MVRLELDHELPVPIEALKIRPDYPRYIEGLEKCEFRSVLEEVREEARMAEQGQGQLF
jgi:DNA polymerase-1